MAGPITLTRPQFAATTAAKKPGASYQGYLSFVARRRAANLGAANQNPLAQTPQASINKTVNHVTGMYGAPLPDSQIQSTAQAQLDPIIAAITKKINDQASSASGAISANSQALAKAMGQVDFGAPYEQAKGEQAAVDAALQQSLGSQGGTQLAGDLQSRLAQIGDPTVQAAGDQIAGRGAAIGGTEVAHGSSNLGALIASAAAAKSYGQKLPGIAGLQGLEDIAGVNRQAVSDIGNQTGAVLNQLPQIVASLRSENQTLRGNRASAAQQIMETLTGQNITKATAAAGLGVDTAKVAQAGAYDAAKVASDKAKQKWTQSYDAAKVKIAQQNADAGTQRAQIAAWKATHPAPKTTKGSTLSAGQVATISKNAAKDAEDLYHGVTKTVGGKQVVVSYTQTYQDAIKTLTQRYPSLGKKGVLSLVNSWYKPGEFGRPKPNKSITTGPTLAQAGR